MVALLPLAALLAFTALAVAVPATLDVASDTPRPATKTRVFTATEVSAVRRTGDRSRVAVRFDVRGLRARPVRATLTLRADTADRGRVRVRVSSDRHWTAAAPAPRAPTTHPIAPRRGSIRVPVTRHVRGNGLVTLFVTAPRGVRLRLGEPEHRMTWNRTTWATSGARVAVTTGADPKGPADRPAPRRTTGGRAGAPASAPDPVPGNGLRLGMGRYGWGIIGNDGTRLAEQRAAGVEAKLGSLSWRDFYTAEDVKDEAYIERKRAEFDRLRAAGFKIVLSLGFHDTPAWVHRSQEDTRYVNQWGESYTGGGERDRGDANLVFNPGLRELAARYIRDALAAFGPDFSAIRLGGGRFGELTYPPARLDGRANAYWAFDANAARSNPVPGWTPGEPSPNGEAARFLDWYLQALADYEVWQIDAVRDVWAGPIMMLFPSWGIRPGQARAAVAGDLAGTSPAERNGEVQRGYDFARQVAAIDDPQVIVTTTRLEAGTWDAGADDQASPERWTPVRYLAQLAADHPLRLPAFGENGGQDDDAGMQYAATQMRRYELLGMLWFKEADMTSGRYATLDDLRGVIAAHGT